MGTKSILTIGTLAKATGTNIETIRWYEKVGLLEAPDRTPGNYRAYTAAHLSRLSFIRRARDLGFSLDQIRTLLGIAEQQDQSCEAIDAIARGHLVDVNQKIAALQALGRELDSVIGQCRHGRVAECRIIEALAPTAK
ncbi:MerR family transcriptional regulator [Belnapia rosea]|uniref:DNA-binding transcriptional regulator, MerR family n=1 Tax=Belnapia rosea TaxID=938405 RepID=A0A1G6YYL9_9PROT|nr:helix-turn-helix domain-containing protein [Belnapia rosea]SDD95489.1 DNA-binding transcriptional regulator, MerR family [Belnapia rosea]